MDQRVKRCYQAKPMGWCQTGNQQMSPSRSSPGREGTATHCLCVPRAGNRWSGSAIATTILPHHPATLPASPNLTVLSIGSTNPVIQGASLILCPVSIQRVGGQADLWVGRMCSTWRPCRTFPCTDHTMICTSPVSPLSLM